MLDLVDFAEEESQRLRQELSALRQVILWADPSVLLDGRFEEMIVAPINVVIVARQMIKNLSQMPEHS